MIDFYREGGRMIGEQRLWLCVLLLGISETDAKQVNSSMAGSARQRLGVAGYKKKSAAEARAWRDSDEFGEICGLAGVDIRQAKALKPSVAHRALLALLSGRTDHEVMESINAEAKPAI